MRIFVFGSSITSAYWNGAATYYRGIYKELHRLGHDIVFAEPDILDRQKHRDAGDFGFVESVIYSSTSDIPALLERARGSEVVIKHSGVGQDDELLERLISRIDSARTRTIFWDVDAPATLARVHAAKDDALRSAIPAFDAVLTYGGGDPVIKAYGELGARRCVPIYNGLDAATHFPVPADAALQCDLAFVGNRLPDREERVERFFFTAARLAPDSSFILGGEGWGSKTLPDNVRWIGHVRTEDHNRVNCSARMVLNINRASMAETGFSPPTRVFEAAGAGACTITDAWEGIGRFFEPEREILVASSPDEVAQLLRGHTKDSAAEIGAAMRQRALRDHTYAQRAQSVDATLEALHHTVADVRAAG